MNVTKKAETGKADAQYDREENEEHLSRGNRFADGRLAKGRMTLRQTSVDGVVRKRSVGTNVCMITFSKSRC